MSEKHPDLTVALKVTKFMTIRPMGNVNVCNELYSSLIQWPLKTVNVKWGDRKSQEITKVKYSVCWLFSLTDNEIRMDKRKC